jgi:hypothetical protein
LYIIVIQGITHVLINHNSLQAALVAS